MKLFGSSGGSHAGSHGEKPDQGTAHASEGRVFKTRDEAPEEVLQAGKSKPAVSSAEPGPETPRPEKKKGKALRIVLIVLAALVVLVAAGILAYSIWEKPPEVAQDGPIVVETATPEPTPTPETSQDVRPTATPEPTPTPEPTESGRKEGVYTFLLAAYDQVGANTDTIIVGNLDTVNGTIHLVSIPRDTYVNVPWSVKKLNSVLAADNNDVAAFKKTISGIIGFEVDFYAIVDIQAVEKLIDCIGGVDYNVPINMDYDDPTQDLHIHIAAGNQHLTGAQGVQVLRFRQGNGGTGYPNGDIGRIATQQSFLKSVASQMLTLGNIPNLTKAIDIFEKYVDTDLTANNLAFLAREFLKMKPDGITMATVPGTSTTRDGLSYWVINQEEWLPMLNEDLNPYKTEITSANLNIAR